MFLSLEMCSAALLSCFPEITVHGVLVHASAPQSCVFPLGFGECWAVCMLIVVLLLQFLIPRVPVGRVRDQMKHVVSWLCSYLVCVIGRVVLRVVSSTDTSSKLLMLKRLWLILVSPSFPLISFCPWNQMPSCRAHTSWEQKTYLSETLSLKKKKMQFGASLCCFAFWESC